MLCSRRTAVEEGDYPCTHHAGFYGTGLVGRQRRPEYWHEIVLRSIEPPLLRVVTNLVLESSVILRCVGEGQAN